MQKRRLFKHIRPMVLAVLIACFGSSSVLAITSNSTNYQMTESQFSSGLNGESCSDQYCAKASIGDLAVGGSSSAGSSAEFGSITNEEPTIEVIVDPGESNLGILSTEKTATKTTVIRIRNYLSGGYMLQIIGDPPKYGDHTLSTPKTPTGSVAGTEQFGINAAFNSIPDVGVGPVQIPSGATSFGTVGDDYKVANSFKYISGDVIARSLTESGRTDYTISMIVNVSNATPAGHYSGDFSAVVIPFY